MTTVPSKTVEAKPKTAGGRRVLLAEDAPVTQSMLKLVLNRRGHQVDCFTHGNQALEALRTNQYDALLLDFNLPGMKGAKIAATIRAEAKAEGRKPPELLAITADVEGLLLYTELQVFDQVFPKPLDLHRIRRLVEQ